MTATVPPANTVHLSHKSTWTWTKKRLLGAKLLAEDELTDEQIAAQLGINRRALARWKEHLEFTERIREYAEVWRQKMMERGLAQREKRVESYKQDFERLNVILQERGADMKDVPGGKTGFIARDYKGKDADTPVYAFDAALAKERRELRKQLAQELGQWSDKAEVTTTLQVVPVTVFDEIIREADVIDVTPELPAADENGS